jgi:hypothetical protein|tara:strand:- start:485 stop:760 length:276 start_codon:yes stop_codon:yes gene_type:complete
MKNKHLIKKYTLSDGQKVTCRQVADEIQISESAARNRLNRSDDPKKIFAPYLRSNGGQLRKQDRDKLKGTKKNDDRKTYEEYLLKKVLKTI